jgi:hypothetical protein
LFELRVKEFDAVIDQPTPSWILIELADEKLQTGLLPNNDKELKRLLQLEDTVVSILDVKYIVILVNTESKYAPSTSLLVK